MHSTIWDISNCFILLCFIHWTLLVSFYTHHYKLLLCICYQVYTVGYLLLAIYYLFYNRGGILYKTLNEEYSIDLLLRISYWKHIIVCVFWWRKTATLKLFITSYLVARMFCWSRSRQLWYQFAPQLGLGCGHTWSIYRPRTCSASAMYYLHLVGILMSGR